MNSLSIEQIIGSVETTFYEKSSLRDCWPAEESFIRDSIQEISREIERKYSLGECIGVGGSGIILQVTDNELGEDRALKLSRPGPEYGFRTADQLEAEAKLMTSLLHPNIVRIFTKGTVTASGGKPCPYFVMDLVNEAKDLRQFIRLGEIGIDKVFDLLKQLCMALSYLHGRKLAHLDLKPSNILIDDCERLQLSDLGLAKDLHALHEETGADAFTYISGTEGFMHPDAKRSLCDSGNDLAFAGMIRGTCISLQWDIYSLGRTILSILNELDSKEEDKYTYGKRYLRLIAYRCLDSHNQHSDTFMGINISTYKEIKYRNIEEILLDVRKYLLEYSIESSIPELSVSSESLIQSRSPFPTVITDRIRCVLRDKSVIKLSKYPQLGLLNLVYPTATHSRLEHAIGTYSVACQYIRSLYNDASNPLFKQIMNEEDIKSAILATLLHDIGQYPLAHDLEESDSSLRHEMDGHEILSHHADSLKLLCLDRWGVELERVCAILFSKNKLNLKDMIIRSIINGPIDADKIDYLIRDSENLGLAYASAIDTKRLVRCLTVSIVSGQGITEGYVGIHEKGKIAAEGVLFARYAMYAQVYWHHTFRAIKAMIHRLWWNALSVAGSKNEKVLRREFRDFVRPLLSNQPELPKVYEEDRIERLSSQIQGEDYSVLEWIAKKGNNDSAMLFELLKKRRIYKRVMVLSKGRGSKSWESVSAFFANYRSKWEDRLNLSLAFQSYVAELIKIDETVSGKMPNDHRNRFVSLIQSEAPIFLVDCPVSKIGSKKDLFILLEDDQKLPQVDLLSQEAAKVDNVWSALRKSYDGSISKVRVFCHPDWHTFVERHFKREELDLALSKAVESIS